MAEETKNGDYEAAEPAGGGAQMNGDAVETTAAATRMKTIMEAERAVEKAFTTGKADRAKITQEAHDLALKAADLVSIAVEADAESDELARMAIIAENSNDREKIKAARRRAKEARAAAKQAHRTATRVGKDAYDAIKFSEPGRLGFMRVVQVVFAINILATLFALLMTSRDVIVYDTFTVMNWIEIILQGIAFWFFINFYKATRPFVMVSSAFSILVPVLVDLLNGEFNIYVTLIESSWYLFLFFYFWLSKRVKATLVNDFSSFKPAEIDADFEINRKGWPFVRNLIMYFIVFSVLGHWMEAAMCQLIRLGLVQGEYDASNTMLWRDWLYPYPMEGAAVVIIALFLYPLWRHFLKKWPDKPFIGYALSFLLNGLTCGIIEFSMGLVVNANHQLWDYTNMPFNIMGQVCLQNVAAFAAAASLICWLVYPMLERWLARIPNDSLNIAFVVIAIFGGILWSLYIVDPPENHAAEREQLAKEQGREDYSAEIELDLLSTISTAEDMKGYVEKTEGLTPEQREQIQKEIDEILSSGETIANQLAAA